MNCKSVFSFCFAFLLASDAPLLQAQQKTDYVLVFSDEFNLKNGSQPDPQKWQCPRRMNNTWRRWVSGDKRVVFINKGHLVCRAIPNRANPSDSARMLTGAVDTEGRFSFQYGMVEVRMRTNLRRGNFPAAWMMPQPTNKPHRYGEIDIFESFGTRNEATHNVHTYRTVELKKKSKAPTSFKETVDVTKWHVYGVEWTPNYIAWTVDGKTVGVYRKSTNPEELREGQWTFDHPFFLRLNQSVGDETWKERPDYSKKYETRFDWIRVYQRK